MSAPDALQRAARALLDAYQGDFPDWMLIEARDLAQALATLDSEQIAAPIDHALAALAHLHSANTHLARLEAVRAAKRVDHAVRGVEAFAKGQQLSASAERLRADGRGAGFEIVGGSDHATT